MSVQTVQNSLSSEELLAKGKMVKCTTGSRSKQKSVRLLGSDTIF